jgi:hypothetical protein
MGSDGRITIPSSAQIGDFAVMCDLCQHFYSSDISQVTPSGWTNFATDAMSVAGVPPYSYYYRGVASYKKLVSGDPGKQITGMVPTGLNAQSQKFMMVFRPNYAITSLAKRYGDAHLDNDNVEALTCYPDPTLGSGPPILIVGFSACMSGSGAFSTNSPAFQGQQQSSTGPGGGNTLGGYLIYPGDSWPGGAHVYDMNDRGDINWLVLGWWNFAD